MKKIVQIEECQEWERLTKRIKKQNKRKYFCNEEIEKSCIEPDIQPVYYNIGEFMSDNLYTNREMKCKTSNLEMANSSTISKKIGSEIKKGTHKIDAVLDLHGFTVDDAFYTLQRFIINEYSNNNRSLLIIVGKGNPYNVGNRISDKIHNWMNSRLIRDYIQYYDQSHIKHGGSGAFYVMLCRK